MNAGTAAQINPLPGMEVLTSDIVQSLRYGNGFGLFKVNVTQMWDALEPWACAPLPLSGRQDLP